MAIRGVPRERRAISRAPAGSMNRRQLEGLAGAGAFDGLEPNRAKVLANADMLLAVADEAERTRSSGQAGLFGGEDHTAPSLRLAETPAWPRAEQMAKERENFGFYFAAHPVACRLLSRSSSHGGTTGLDSTTRGSSGRGAGGGAPEDGVGELLLAGVQAHDTSVGACWTS